MRNSRTKRTEFQSLDAAATDGNGIVQVSETSAVSDEGLGHIESNGAEALASDDSAGGDLQGVVSCFVNVTLPPLADLPRSSDVRGVVFTDERGTLLGHTVFTGSVTEATAWPYVGVGQPSPYGSQADALRGFDIALEMKSIVARLGRLRTGFNLLILGAVGFGALLQLGYPIA